MEELADARPLGHSHGEEVVAVEKRPDVPKLVQVQAQSLVGTRPAARQRDTRYRRRLHAAKQRVHAAPAEARGVEAVERSAEVGDAPRDGCPLAGHVEPGGRRADLFGWREGQRRREPNGFGHGRVGVEDVQGRALQRQGGMNGAQNAGVAGAPQASRPLVLGEQ